MGHRKRDGWMQGLQTDPRTVHTYEQTWTDGVTLQTKRSNSPPHTHNGGFEKQQFTSTWPQRRHLPLSLPMKGNCNITVQQGKKRILLCHMYGLTLKQLWVKMPVGSSARQRERPPVSGPAHLWCRMTPSELGTPLHFDLHTTDRWTNTVLVIIICKLITCRVAIFNA